jgi:hypothetical protein
MTERVSSCMMQRVLLSIQATSSTSARSSTGCDAGAADSSPLTTKRLHGRASSIGGAHGVGRFLRPSSLSMRLTMQDSTSSRAHTTTCEVGRRVGNDCLPARSQRRSAQPALRRRSMRSGEELLSVGRPDSEVAQGSRNRRGLPSSSPWAGRRAERPADIDLAHRRQMRKSTIPRNPRRRE